MTQFEMAQAATDKHISDAKHTILSGCGFTVEFDSVIKKTVLKSIAKEAAKLISDLKAACPSLFDKPQAEPIFIEIMRNILFCEWLRAKVKYSKSDFIIFENILREAFKF